MIEIFTIFPNRFNKGPYILTFFKGLQGPTQAWAKLIERLLLEGVVGLPCAATGRAGPMSHLKTSSGDLPKSGSLITPLPLIGIIIGILIFRLKNRRGFTLQGKAQMNSILFGDTMVPNIE